MPTSNHCKQELAKLFGSELSSDDDDDSESEAGEVKEEITDESFTKKPSNESTVSTKTINKALPTSNGKVECKLTTPPKSLRNPTSQDLSSIFKVFSKKISSVNSEYIRWLSFFCRTLHCLQCSVTLALRWPRLNSICNR